MKTRKEFLKKMIGLASLSLPVLLFKLFGKKGKSDKEITGQGISMSKQMIKSVRRMGFQWETIDPFLFCVHHEDFSP